jgi:outer membrane protein assembly factor BamD
MQSVVNSQTLRNMLALAVLLCLAIGSLGCGKAIDKLFNPGPEETALTLYEAGEASLAAEEYGSAIQSFTKLKDQFPFSPYTMPGELKLADAYFRRGDMPQAIAAYKEYEALHPRDENIPYVLYQIGVASTYSFDSIDRPMSAVSDGLEHLNRLKQSFPETPYAKMADEYIAKSRRLLAEHELFIADFYWHSGRYVSAWRRYAFVAENYGDIDEIGRYATQRSRMAYLEHQRKAAEDERAEKHGSFKKLFDWL